jgi:processive 1,2-diacylglycerol beta-glucosyltransferase
LDGMSQPNIVLIFTASTGGGHNLAAQSLQKNLGSRGYDVRIVDTFKASSKILDKMITGGYEKMVGTTPKLYDLLYRKFDKMTAFQRGIFHIGTSLISPEIMSLILDDSPVLLISPHPFVTNVLGRMKGMKAFHIPILSIVTDYKFHGVYKSQNVNAYVVGSAYTKADMIERGIDPGIIYPYGIPVREGFEQEQPPARRERGTVLLMGGSLGDSRMADAFRALLQTEEAVHILAVCGRNEDMAAKLSSIPYETLRRNPRTKAEVFGYVDQISELMGRADLMVTKPGGLTTTEAILRGIPMLIPYTYPGQEESNAEFLEESGMGIRIGTMEELPGIVDHLLKHQGIVEEMADNMNTAAQHYAPEKLAALCEKLIENYLAETSENSDK